MFEKQDEPGCVSQEFKIQSFSQFQIWRNTFQYKFWPVTEEFMNNHRVLLHYEKTKKKKGE